MKKTYQNPETKVRLNTLDLAICQPTLSDNPADPTLPEPVEGKGRFEDEKGFGQYQW